MSEPLDQLLSDLSAIDHFLSIEAFIGNFSTKQIPNNFETLNYSGLDDREFSTIVTQGLLTAKIARSHLPLVTGTLVLYLAGRFESFVREKIGTAAREIGNTCGQFDRLPKNMQVSLLNQTVEVIKNPRKFGHAEAGVRAFVKRLAAGYSSINDKDPVNFECISITEANMKPEVFKEICDRIGFTEAWNQIAAQTNMKRFFENMDGSVVSKDAQAMLRKLMDDRNAVAHPVGATTFPNTVTIFKYVAFVKILCMEFEAVLDMYVALIQPLDIKS